MSGQPQEAVVEGLLCYSNGTIWIPYSPRQMSDMLLKARLEVATLKLDALRYRLARQPEFGVTHFVGRKRCRHQMESADELLDAEILRAPRVGAPLQ